MNPASIRASIAELTGVCRSDFSAAELECDESLHIAAPARRKASAIDAELEALAGNEEAALVKLEVTRDAAVAAGRPADEVAPFYEARAAEVRAAATHKRVALQSEAVAVDVVLEHALAAVDALTEAAASLDDTELVARAPALFQREAAARAAVATISDSPTTNGFLDLAAVPLVSSVAVKVASADLLFGRVLVAPILAPHIHTSHCEPDCTIRFAPHRHSSACNHARVPLGAVWAAAKRGDIAGLEAALEAGGSTEGMDAFFQTALHFASGNGNLEAVRMLVAAGAEVNAKSRGVAGPLHMAINQGHAHVAAFLLADPRVDPTAARSEDFFWTALHKAAHLGSVPIVAILLADPRVDVNALTKDGCTPLHLAARQGHNSVVSALLADPRVDVCVANAGGHTARYLAMSYVYGGSAITAMLEAAEGRAGRS